MLEAKKHLGGRAFSFAHSQSETLIDNCQHVLMGCCNESVRFLTKIGSIELVEFLDKLNVIGESGETLEIATSLLPAPLHLLPSIIRTDYLSTRDKLNLSRVMLWLLLTVPAKESSAAQYLKMLSCPESLIKRLIEPILVSALNEDLDQASAKYARMVLLKSLLGSRNGYKLGIPRVPLSKLIEEPAIRYLSRENCRVRTGAKVEKINIAQGRVQSLSLDNGERFSSDYYVSAVNPWSLSAMGFDVKSSGELKWRPIISVHIFSDSDFPDFDHACILGEPFQWVFNKSRDFGLGSTYIQAVASGADSIVNLSKDELVELAMNAVRRASPEARAILQPNNCKTVICKEKRATFSTSCGSDASRPSTITSLSNLFLAGDWTRTNWPSTIESAVRSGRAAAQAVIEAANNTY